jgi:hypothetical protein
MPVERGWRDADAPGDLLDRDVRVPEQGLGRGQVALAEGRGVVPRNLIRGRFAQFVP